MPSINVDDELTLLGQVLQDSVPYPLSGVADVLFGLNTTYGLSTFLYATTSTGADPSWDSYANGRISWSINLRNDNIYAIIDDDNKLNVIAEVWVRNQDEANFVLLTQQKVELRNHVLEFPGTCGIGSMVISASSGCIFKIY